MRTTVAGFIAATLLTAFTQPVAATESYQLDIPAQPLTKALQTFARQSGLSLVHYSGLVDKRPSPPLQGTYTPEAALRKLLENTGLEFVYVNDTTIEIRPVVRKGAPATGDASQTDVLHLADAAPGSRGLPSPVASAARTEEAGGDESAATLEEIVVTAQKRTERLIDTPQSVSVVSAEALSRTGATQFRDFADTVPGLSFTTSGAGSTQVSMRGVTTGADVNQTVAIYVDEVPYGSSTSFGRSGRYSPDGALFDLERIEVLRGPQGTLYGASSMGGLLKYVSRAPSLRETSAAVRTLVSGTEQGGVGYGGSARFNTPLIQEKLGLRVSGYYTRDGGYVNDVGLGHEDINRAALYGGRADLLVQPSDPLTIRLTADLQYVSRDGVGAVDYSATKDGQPLFGELAQQRSITEPFDQQFRLFAATVGYTLGELALTSVSSYQQTRIENRFDISPQFVPLFSRLGLGDYSAVGLSDVPGTNKFTQEVRLSSLGEQTLEWVVGSFYTHEKSARESELTVLALDGQPVPNVFYALSAPSTYEEYAAFGDLTWRITDRFDVTGGVRYAHNEQAYTQFGSGLLIGSVPTARSGEGVVTYLANARYRFNEHATTYARFATGYRPGGPNFVSRDPVTGAPLSPPAFDADRLRSYEIGSRFETESRTFSVDASVFYIDWIDIQVFDTSSTLGAYTNSPAANIRGGEISLNALVAGGLTLSGNAGYQYARRAGADTDPQYSAAFNADYVFPGTPLGPTIGATWRYVSDRGSSIASTTPQDLPSYDTFDLRGGLTFGRVDAQLYARNVFDSRGKLSLTTGNGRPVFSILQPRTIGLSLSVSL